MQMILEEEFTRLIAGSYERLVVRLAESVNENAKSLFGTDGLYQLAATFKGHAIVHNEDFSKIYRVKYNLTENNEVDVVSAEEISLKSFTANEYAAMKAKAFVEDFMSGAKTSAAEHFNKLVRVAGKLEAVVESTPYVSPVEQIAADLSAVTTWKKIFSEKSELIKESIQTNIGDIESSKLKTKYRSLYSTGTNSLTESESSAYRELLTSDLKQLLDRFSKLASVTESAFNSYKGHVSALRNKPTDKTIEIFESFASDYLSNLMRIKNSLAESSKSAIRIDESGKIYDLLASELFTYEVAGKFVEKMSGNLMKVTSEEG